MEKDGRPTTRDELLALPIWDIADRGEGRYTGLAVLKPEGCCFAAADDNGDWWVVEYKDGWRRRAYPCCP